MDSACRPSSTELQQLLRKSDNDVKLPQVATHCISSKQSTLHALRQLANIRQFWCRAFAAAVTTIVLSACIAAVIVHAALDRKPLDAAGCQVSIARFKSAAVLQNLKQQSAAAARLDNSSPQKLHILTVVGKSTPMQKVKQSPLLQSLPPAMRQRVWVLQADEPVGHGKHIYGSAAFGAKIIELYNFINRRHVSPKDLVLLTDGFDVAIDAKALDKVPAHFAAITSSRSLLSQQDGFWRGSNSSTNSTPHDLALVFAAERGLWPDDVKATCYPRPASATYHYLNAGGLVGHAGYIKALLQPYINHVTRYMDDQRFYTDAYLALREMNGFFLDYGCSIFQTLYNVSVGGDDLKFDSSVGSWYNLKTKTYPVLLHGQGSGAKPVFFDEVVPKMAATWEWQHQ